MRYLTVTQCKGNGAGSCKRCTENGKWNQNWMCFLYKIDGLDGCYCRDCVKEIKENEHMENERITKCGVIYSTTNIKNELDSFTISQAFNKLQRYEELGTVENFKELKEKSIVKSFATNGNTCGNCFEDVSDWRINFCPNCGQRVN